MLSLRARFIRSVIALPKLFSEPASAANLSSKRKAYMRGEKLFPMPAGVEIERVVAEGFKAEWVKPIGVSAQHAILYIHGGGFVFNSTKLHRRLVAELCRASDAVGLSVDYSLAPEHPFPAALYECLHAYKWLLKNGYKSQDIAVAGDSAGGTLALALAKLIRDEGLKAPACIIALSPATDAATPDNRKTYDFLKPESVAYFTEAYFQNASLKHPLGSPIYGSLKNLPPILIHIDKSEVLHKNAVRFYNKARRQGVDITMYESEGLWHVWHLFTHLVPEAKQAVREVGNFVKTYIGKKT